MTVERNDESWKCVECLQAVNLWLQSSVDQPEGQNAAGPSYCVCAHAGGAVLVLWCAWPGVLCTCCSPVVNQHLPLQEHHAMQDLCRPLQVFWTFQASAVRLGGAEGFHASPDLSIAPADANTTWEAGSAVQLFVQLRDANATNVTADFDPRLQAGCRTDPTAPVNASFCIDGPFIVPLGKGAYSIHVTFGTIWGAYDNHQGIASSSSSQ